MQRFILLVFFLVTFSYSSVFDMVYDTSVSNTVIHPILKQIHLIYDYREKSSWKYRWGVESICKSPFEVSSRLNLDKGNILYNNGDIIWVNLDTACIIIKNWEVNSQDTSWITYYFKKRNNDWVVTKKNIYKLQK